MENHMKVRELEELLGRLDPDLKIVVEYRWRFDDPYEIHSFDLSDDDIRIIDNSCLVVSSC